jgi:serine-type D-Ala-D-Ala carboxypeptidase (penicillin-binding protein 5/6)
MNKIAREIGMKNTNFANPHGLPNSLNKSTAEDLIKLCSLAIKCKEFIDIVSKKTYIPSVENYKDIRRELVWTNTNKLLDSDQGFYGIKTGVTVPAGPCLATYFKSGSYSYLFVVLGSKSLDMRFSDAKNLMWWLFREFERNSNHD